jgi:hypothetical protein
MAAPPPDRLTSGWTGRSWLVVRAGEQVDDHRRDAGPVRHRWRAISRPASSRSQRGSITVVVAPCHRAQHAEHQPVMWNIGTTPRLTALGPRAGPRWPRPSRCASACGGCACSPWAGRWCPRCRAAGPGRRHRRCAGRAGGPLAPGGQRIRPAGGAGGGLAAGSGGSASSHCRMGGAGFRRSSGTAGMASVQRVARMCSAAAAPAAAGIGLGHRCRPGRRW